MLLPRLLVPPCLAAADTDRHICPSATGDLPVLQP
jgi:hypothetical protein